jgi:hypothetical protein
VGEGGEGRGGGGRERDLLGTFHHGGLGRRGRVREEGCGGDSKEGLCVQPRRVYDSETSSCVLRVRAVRVRARDVGVFRFRRQPIERYRQRMSKTVPRALLLP